MHHTYITLLCLIQVITNSLPKSQTFPFSESVCILTNSDIELLRRVMIVLNTAITQKTVDWKIDTITPCITHYYNVYTHTVHELWRV